MLPSIRTKAHVRRITWAGFLTLFFLLNATVTYSIDTVTVGIMGDLSRIDSLTSTLHSSGAEKLRVLLFDSLIAKNEVLDYEGQLTESFTTSPDGHSIAFRLRPGVRFHNGQELTSADVKYTLDTLLESRSYKSFAFFETIGPKQVRKITAVETPDRRTIVIRLLRASVHDLILAYLSVIPIIQAGTVEQIASSPVGTGPFILENFDAESGLIELKANRNYWNGRPSVSRLRIRALPDPKSTFEALQTGQIDLVQISPEFASEYETELSRLKDFQMHQSPGTNIQYLGFNVTAKVVRDARIRKAISHAIDRERIIREILGGRARVAHSALPDQSWVYSAGNRYRFDRALAKQLLKQAGYKRQRVTNKIGTGASIFAKVAGAVRDDLVSVGLHAEVEIVEPIVLRMQLMTGEFQMNMGTWIGGNEEPLFLNDLYSSARIPGIGTSCCNRSRYSNATADTLLEQAQSSLDRNEKRELFARISSLVSKDVPMLPLWHPANIVVANKRIENVKIAPWGDWGYLTKITFTTHDSKQDDPNG